LAAYRDEELLDSVQLNPQQQSAQSLAPGMKGLLSHVGWNMTDVELVAVTHGPGSFTGLRVGVTTAKTFAYATGCQLLGLDTLEIIACQSPDTSVPVYSVLDAQRGQLYSACYQIGKTGLPKCIDSTAIIDADAWLEQLPSGTIVTGSGLNKVADRLPSHVQKTPEEFWIPTAETAGRLALLHYRSGRRDDHWKLVPQYYRKSAAEEKLEKNRKPSSEN